MGHPIDTSVEGVAFLESPLNLLVDLSGQIDFTVELAEQIEGVGPGFVPPVWRSEIADEIIRVSTAEAKEMARRLSMEEAIFAGTSSGANVVAALRVASRLEPDQTVGTIACDTGLKYLSTDLYSAR